MSGRSYLSIGDVLSLLRHEFPDVTISKIRFLESQGLVNPERTPSGYRKFYEPDVERLRWVLRQQREHFLPLKVIKDRLDDIVHSDDINGQSEPAAPSSTARESSTPALAGRPVGAVSGSARAARPAAPESWASNGARVTSIAERRGPGMDQVAPLQPARPVSPLAAESSSRIAQPVGASPAALTQAPSTVAIGLAAPSSESPTREAADPTGLSIASPAVGPQNVSLGSHTAPASTSGRLGSEPPSGSDGPAHVTPPQDRPPETPPQETSAGSSAPSGASALPMDKVEPAKPTTPPPSTPPSTPPPAPPAIESPSTTPAPAPSPPAPLRSGPEGATAMGAHITFDELSAASGGDAGVLVQLREYGLLACTNVGGTEYYDNDALAVATLAARFSHFGVEPRHLRLYKNAADREFGFVEQIVLPLVRQRNPEARAKAVATSEELIGLGKGLRAALLRSALRDLFGN